MSSSLNVDPHVPTSTTHMNDIKVLLNKRDYQEMILRRHNMFIQPRAFAALARSNLIDPLVNVLEDVSPERDLSLHDMLCARCSYEPDTASEGYDYSGGDDEIDVNETSANDQPIHVNHGPATKRMEEGNDTRVCPLEEVDQASERHDAMNATDQNRFDSKSCTQWPSKPLR